ncbi:MAG TPA: hypothetical protein PLL10_06665, partial [Elusimicrobiales bacterium]|nr:hypothetical protein [Elusimicrobiales bacterium]
RLGLYVVLGISMFSPLPAMATANGDYSERMSSLDSGAMPAYREDQDRLADAIVKDRENHDVGRKSISNNESPIELVTSTEETAAQWQGVEKLWETAGPLDIAKFLQAGYARVFRASYYMRSKNGQEIFIGEGGICLRQDRRGDFYITIAPLYSTRDPLKLQHDLVRAMAAYLTPGGEMRTGDSMLDGTFGNVRITPTGKVIARARYTTGLAYVVATEEIKPK